MGKPLSFEQWVGVHAGSGKRMRDVRSSYLKHVDAEKDASWSDFKKNNPHWEHAGDPEPVVTPLGPQPIVRPLPEPTVVQLRPTGPDNSDRALNQGEYMPSDRDRFIEQKAKMMRREEMLRARAQLMEAKKKRRKREYFLNAYKGLRRKRGR